MLSHDVNALTHRYENWVSEQATMIRKDVLHKHQRMAASPWAFFRGSFYFWAAIWPSICTDHVEDLQVLAVGDAHLENFGTWRDKEGRLLWGLNDLDEAYPLPYTFDLVRLASSAELALIPFHPVTLDDVCKVLLEGYAAGLDVPQPCVLFEYPVLEQVMAPCLAAQRNHFLSRDNESFLEADEGKQARQALLKCLPQGASSVQFYARRAGLGSLGRRRVVARSLWQGGVVAREAKRLVPSGAAWAASDSRNRLFVEDASNAVWWTRMPRPSYGEKYVVRPLAPDAAKIDLDLLNQTPLSQGTILDWLRSAATQLALLHHRSNRRRAIQRNLAIRPASWLGDASQRMSTAMTVGWHDFVEAHQE